MISKSILGWVLVAGGSALWAYGYFVPASTPFLDWKSMTPWWIADYVPSKEAELGLVLLCIGMIPLYWPATGRA